MSHKALSSIVCPHLALCLVTSRHLHSIWDNLPSQSTPIHNFDFLGEVDEVFLILLYTVDQVGNGLGLTQEFCLENGRTVHVVLVRPRLNISVEVGGHYFVTVNKMCVTETPYRRCSGGLPPPFLLVICTSSSQLNTAGKHMSKVTTIWKGLLTRGQCQQEKLYSLEALWPDLLSICWKNSANT